MKRRHLVAYSTLRTSLTCCGSYVCNVHTDSVLQHCVCQSNCICLYFEFAEALGGKEKNKKTLPGIFLFSLIQRERGGEREGGGSAFAFHMTFSMCVTYSCISVGSLSHTF